MTEWVPVSSEAEKKTIPKPRHDASPLRIPAAPDPTLTTVREGAKVTPQNVATKFKIMPAEHCWHGTGPVPNALLMLAVRCSGLVCHRNNTSWAVLHHEFHMAFPKIKMSCSHHFCPMVVLLMSHHSALSTSEQSSRNLNLGSLNAGPRNHGCSQHITFWNNLLHKLKIFEDQHQI